MFGFGGFGFRVKVDPIQHPLVVYRPKAEDRFAEKATKRHVGSGFSLKVQ